MKKIRDQNDKPSTPPFQLSPTCYHYFLSLLTSPADAPPPKHCFTNTVPKQYRRHAMERRYCLMCKSNLLHNRLSVLFPFVYALFSFGYGLFPFGCASFTFHYVMISFDYALFSFGYVFF